MPLLDQSVDGHPHDPRVTRILADHRERVARLTERTLRKLAAAGLDAEHAGSLLRPPRR